MTQPSLGHTFLITVVGKFSMTSYAVLWEKNGYSGYNE
jgi:hypothetical protein